MSSREGEQTEKPKRRRHRPNAAQKERERQRVFREAFAALRGHLPLESSKKIPKRDILRLAAQYIKYLTNLLHQPAKAEGVVHDNEGSLAVSVMVKVEH
ncbi:neurogenic differentiation factor 1 [Paramuricea clavata]|uniref:Neurogenic differentiation factor 1 n=1 Tax=Paramuricea clavata TaxID=317549 RepID=A0A6S7H7K8_PARCT|nr:neurogenic differentiation factor 1 [Paramuricea clavata]